MSNQSNPTNDKPRTVQDIIREIEQKSKEGGYIYRGERKCNPKVSSKLYRDFEIEVEHFNIELVQKEMLAAAKRHTGDLPHDYRVDVTVPPKEESIDFEILTEIQHYGGKTNLIDFTTDYFIALFFACDGRYNENGRVILQKKNEISDMIAHPQNPRHRVIAQKSVFVRPPRGFIEPHENDIVIISANLKEQILEHLRNYHGISKEIIYNDLYGFIRNQDIHGDAYTHFYKGFACGSRGDQESTFEAKQAEYENAIKHFTKAISLKPDLAGAYFNRGVTYAFRGEFEDAIKDFDTVIQLQPDHAGAYYNRGNTYGDKGEPDNAIKDFNKAIEIDAYYLNAYYNRGFVYLKKGEFNNTITDFDKVIELNPDDAGAYCIRGEAWLHLQEWEKAKTDLITAKDMGADIIASFHNDYASIEDFEQKTGIQLPEDIAALLTPP